jgi:hypothetical protein
MILRLSWFGLVALFAVAFVAACQLIVNPGEAPIKCKVEGSTDPCPRGMSCVEGTCKTYEDCQQEVCEDGIDNDCDHKVDEQDDSIPDDCDEKDDDCDGMVDETAKAQPEYCNGVDDDCDEQKDEGWDEDGDGFYVCGVGGDWKSEADCEDTNEKAHPGLREECDGLNNDCDGNTDEDATCPGEQLCRGGSCIARSCAIVGSGRDCAANERCVNGVCEKMDCATPCGPNQFCDKNTNTCLDIPRRKNGDGCTVDTDCASGLCVDSAAFVLPATAPKRVCGKTCCSDADCTTAGEGCFVSPTGARSCLPRSLALITAAPSSTTPAPTCTANSDCPSGNVCSALDAYQGRTRVATTVCRAPGLFPERPAFEQCGAPPSCNTRMCLPLIILDACTAPCRVNSDCARFREYNPALGGFCQYVQLSEISSVPAGYFAPVCVARLEAEDSMAPPGCRTSNQCPDGACLGASETRMGRCSPTCCSDVHCTSLGDTSRCVPVARGTGRFEMRCTVPQ